jgi:hypothetical protein
MRNILLRKMLRLGAPGIKGKNKLGQVSAGRDGVLQKRNVASSVAECCIERRAHENRIGAPAKAARHEHVALLVALCRAAEHR